MPPKLHYNFYYLQHIRLKNLEEKRMLGIIGAMDEEVAKIKEEMTDVSVTTVAGMDFYQGKLCLLYTSDAADD